MTTRTRLFTGAILSLATAAFLFLAGCVDEPPPRPHRVYAQPQAVTPNTDVYAYPTHGQTQDQQDRDRYECSLWATKQTGFDPSAPNVPPHDRIRVVSAGPPPGTGTAIGAVTGAILGAVVAGPRDGGAGAVVGGLVGAGIGSASDAQRAQEQHDAIAAAAAQNRQENAAFEQQATNYRRAISACLDARGYSVK
jgi:hypothetical protein